MPVSKPEPWGSWALMQKTLLNTKHWSIESCPNCLIRVSILSQKIWHLKCFKIQNFLNANSSNGFGFQSILDFDFGIKDAQPAKSVQIVQNFKTSKIRNTLAPSILDRVPVLPFIVSNRQSVLTIRKHSDLCNHKIIQKTIWFLPPSFSIFWQT